MTRDEAIAKVKKSNVGWWHPERLIDFLSELGVLKLDEPKNPELRAGAIMDAHVGGSITADILLDIDRAGLKIVEK